MSSDYYFFEEQEYDIPFYRKKPRLTKTNHIILLIGLIIASITPFVIPSTQYIPKALIITLTTLIPVLYTLRGNLDTIFRIPQKHDILIIIIGALTYTALSILVSSILTAIGVPTPQENPISTNTTITIIIMVIQLLGEELLKFIAFVLVMAYAYKRTNRKNSILIALIASQLLFAIIHIPAYGLNIPHLLFSIGIVSSILPIIYLRTKNITVTYITHIIIDIIPLLLATDINFNFTLSYKKNEII